MINNKINVPQLDKTKYMEIVYKNFVCDSTNNDNVIIIREILKRYIGEHVIVHPRNIHDDLFEMLLPGDDFKTYVKFDDIIKFICEKNNFYNVLNQAIIMTETTIETKNCIDYESHMVVIITIDDIVSYIDYMDCRNEANRMMKLIG